jgi:hypothetical protein
LAAAHDIKTLYIRREVADFEGRLPYCNFYNYTERSIIALVRYYREAGYRSLTMPMHPTDDSLSIEVHGDLRRVMGSVGLTGREELRNP